MSESILNENLIATFEQSLRQTRNAQNRLMVRLREVETEGDRLREEIEALENSAEQTEAAIYSILATMGSKHPRGSKDKSRNSKENSRQDSFNPKEDIRREDRDEYRSSRSRNDGYSSNNYQGDSRDNSTSIFSNDRNGLYRKNDNNSDYYRNNNNYNNNNRNRNNNDQNYSNNNNNNRSVPQVGHNIEPISQRFSERTITQSCTLLLRERGEALHVNELYNFLVAGGFEFKGNNPTISIAVSLNRNRRFKKVAPGTFDLIMRDASQAAS